MSDQTPPPADPVPNLGPGTRAADAAARALDDQRHATAYAEMLTTFLAQGPQAASTPAGAVLAAQCCGVVLMPEVAAMAGAIGTAVSAGDGAYVYFEGVGRRPRSVKLTPVARVVAAALRHRGLKAADALRSFVDWLNAYGPALFRGLAKDRSAQLAAVERGGSVFWSKHLPQLLVQDARGVLTLRPLRPEALARWVSGQPLVAGVQAGPALFAASASRFQAAAHIDGSHIVASVVAIMKTGDGKRLATTRAAQLEALEPLLDEAASDAVGMLMVLIAVGFCERGSVQTSDPSHSLTSRYIQELAMMFGAKPELAARLAKMAPAERRAAYAELLNHGKDPTDAKSALSNADMHLCDAIGCEPSRFVADDEASVARRPTRYLSTLERQVIADASPSLAPTPEAMAVTGAVSAIVTSEPVRPGDMLDACFEDLELHGRRVVLNLRRRAARKGQKTATAEGPIEFTDPEVTRRLAALKELREGQNALDGDPLWGRDLEESRRLYAQACSIVDRVAKHCSGDRVESFYSCRHGIVSDDLLKALLLDDPAEAQAAAKAVSVRARHRDLQTTVEEYFRFGPEVLHHHASKGLGTLLTSAIAAVWSGVRAHALDQRVSRSERARAHTLCAAISEAVPASAFDSIHEDHPCAPGTSQPARTPLKLDDVAFSEVCLQLHFEGVEPALDAGSMAAIAASPWGTALLETRTRYATQWSDTVRPASTRQSKLRGIARRLRSHPDAAAVKSVTRLWRATAKDGYIDVANPTSLHLWLTFLVDAGVRASHLLLRVDETAVPRLEVLSAVFAEVTGYRPAVDQVPSGKGRPAVYLLLSSKDVQRGISPPPRAVEMAGFNALFMAACMREDLGTPGEKEIK